ncbi:lipopolysaccharide kinase InaA family protein [Aliarcobacter cryaerophilus]|uniref:lipopolysaccharide kinase InaA family protein n=1 Tax=Aliarcobacter cryaerophilus TaxID=28198 RepID=UPI0021B5CAF1|nr:lipopolysaccharide kinase InaA family protein [Aliarcobacter cryaerophilus]MCT7539503.1 lipopolysaccharide kinase InaA family protein [Aliarcobacter cryaerophilus]
MLKYKINKSYENIKGFLLNIKDYFKNNSNTIHKARNELKIIDYKGIQTVVKSFKVPNIINQIVYAYFRDSKAKKSYQNAIKLKELNINTPNPIGYIEFYRNYLFKESFFVSEKLDYLFTIREPLRNVDLKDREEIIKKFVAFTYNLHKNCVYHKDYSAGNILVLKNEKNEYDFSLVDINRMEFKPIDLELGLDNFAKLWLDESSLNIIAKEYAKLSNTYEEKAINILKKCDIRLKKFVEFKRKIRGK